MNKIYIFLLISGLFILTECKKKKDPEPVVIVTTVAEDKLNITKSMTELSTCIGAMKDGDGSKAIMDFLNLDSGNALNQSWAESIVKQMDSLLDFNSINSNNRFDFGVNTGTYTWNPATNKYTKTTTPTDKIIINFPSKQSSTTNNSTLTFSNYTDASVTISSAIYYLPTAFNVTLTVDNITLFSVNGSAIYEAPIPININTSVFLKPFTYSFVGSRTSPTTFDATISLSNGSGCNTSVKGHVEFTTSDYANINPDTDIKTISTTVTHNNMQIVTTADVLSLNAISNPTVSQINAYIKSQVYYAGNKVGDLILFDDGTPATKVYIVYKDSTEESVEVYYNPFLHDLNAILLPQFGDLGL